MKKSQSTTVIHIDTDRVSKKSQGDISLHFCYKVHFGISFQRARINKIIMKFMCILVMICLSIESVSSNLCGECQCYPDTKEARVLLCEGLHVFEFPTLPMSIKNELEDILIINTMIRCLPSVSEDEFPNLNEFGERNNEFFDCECLKGWIDVYQDTIFQTSCRYTSIVSTLSSFVTRQKTSPSYTSSTTQDLVTEDYSNIVTSDLSIGFPNVTFPYDNSTTTTSTDTSLLISICLAVGGLITIFIIVISVVLSVYRAKKRANQLRDISFRNPIYRGCEYELRDFVGGAIDEEEV